MLKRLNIYLNEMYPIIPRFLFGGIVFFALYFLVVLVYKVPYSEINLDDKEVIGVFTTFFFWLFLRIADELKDRELDLRLFPHRAYPAGKVLTKDLGLLMAFSLITIVFLNLYYKVSIFWFLIVLTYGILMSFWFFMRRKIQPNLILALITHNPVQLLLNYYLISIACYKYGIDIGSLDILCINLMLYLPGLEWEISRKIKAPAKENDYVTYSRIFGYKKACRILLFISLLELLVSLYIASKISHPLMLLLMVIYYALLCKKVYDFIKEPESPKNLIGKFTQVYIYFVQTTLVVIAIIGLTTKA